MNPNLMFKLPFLVSKSSTNAQSQPTAFTHASSLARRPILTHLNADTSWLLLLPYPPPQNNSSSSSSGTRQYFRILIDPWLSGPQTDVFTWLSTQWHAEEPCFKSIREIEKFIVSIDGFGRHEERVVDCVVVSHEFTDHCHRETLVQLPADTPVFVAGERARGAVEGWGYFDNVVLMGRFLSGSLIATAGEGEWDWRKESRHELLPEWLRISRIESPGNTLYYHSAVMISFPGCVDAAEECILYAPHGIAYPTLESIPTTSNPKLSPLALLHGLDDVRIGVFKYAQLNLGAKNAAKCMRSCGGAKYWIGTHDEKKIAGGVVRRMLWRKSWAVEEIEGEEEDMRGRYVEVGNGESFVLE